MPIHLIITTPERQLVDAQVEQVSVPTALGEITILPHHIPLVAEVVPGELRLRQNGQDEFFAVAGGFVEVRQGNEVVLLADAAERDDELDILKIEEAEARARKVLAELVVADDQSFAQAAAALERELARLRVARRRRPTYTQKPLNS